MTKQIGKKLFYYIKNLLLIVIAAVFTATLCKMFLFQFYIIPSNSMKNALLPGDGILVSKVHYVNRVFNSRIPGFSSIKKNDIVVFKEPGGVEEILIKRCVGLPGDTLLIKDNMVYSTGNKDGFARKGSLVPEIKVLNYENGHVLPRFSRSRNKAEYGPVIVPKKGIALSIDTGNIRIYKNVIEKQEGNIVQVINGQIIINGVVARVYSFKKNYYFMMGDNRRHSADSRYWGFLPEDLVIGKAFFKVFSSNPDKGIRSIKLNSLFKKIN